MTIMSTSPVRRTATRTTHERSSLACRNARLRRTNARLAREIHDLRFAATHDRLTGLFNRAGLEDLWPVPGANALLMLDLDRFKPVNDRFGHLAGDLVLVEVAARLSGLAAVAGRLAGDEFVLVAVDVDPLTVAHRAAEAIAVPVVLPHGVAVTVSASIGVLPLDRPIDFYAALKFADQAMYAAKRGPAPVALADTTAPRSVPLSTEVIR